MYTQDGINLKGQATHGEYVAKLDGRGYPQRNTLDGVIDPKASDSVIVRQIDGRTFEAINKRRGEVLTTSRIVVAADGKTRVTTQTGKNNDGVTLNNTLFWERQ